MDTSELLEPIEISKYKSLIGSGNWLITLGRFDIQFAISTLAQYTANQSVPFGRDTETIWSISA